MPGCPTDDTVALFLGGTLTGDEESAFRQHIDECPACRDLLVEAGREMHDTLLTTRVKPLVAPARQLPATPVAIGDVIRDKYRVDAFVGAGGMGAVFRGTHLVLHRTVAIKMMHPRLMTPDHARRFAREARAAAVLTSEHAVRIIDIDRTDDGTPFIVMEHLEGRDLHEVLMRDGPLHWERAVRYVLEAADAIGEAHARGIIHRDLKPHNLFLTNGDVVKVLDFGLAKAMRDSPIEGSSTDAAAGRPLGSPQYMAPEQIRTEQTIDARTDVYALGATLYQLLSGMAPFLALSVVALFAKILDERPAPLSRIRKDVPLPIEAVVLRCLQKDPEARYASIEELVFALREAVSEAADSRSADERHTDPRPAGPPISAGPDTMVVSEMPATVATDSGDYGPRTIKMPPVGK